MVHNHAYFFTYYEGLRENQDITHGVVVPTVAERSGDFSADTPILLNSTRTPFGNNFRPDQRDHAKYLKFFPIPTRQKIAPGQTTN